MKNPEHVTGHFPETLIALLLGYVLPCRLKACYVSEKSSPHYHCPDCKLKYTKKSSFNRHFKTGEKDKLCLC